MLDQFGTLQPWARVLLLAGMWAFLALVLALGLVRWWRIQRQYDERDARRRAREEQVMDLLRASKRQESANRKRPT